MDMCDDVFMVAFRRAARFMRSCALDSSGRRAPGFPMVARAAHSLSTCVTSPMHVAEGG